MRSAPGRPIREGVWLVLVTTAYFAAGKLGLALAFVHANASAVWPPTGIAVAALLLLGARVWPAIFVGAFLVNEATGGNVASSAGIALGNTLEALLAWRLVERFAQGRRAFERAPDVFRFALLAGLVSTTVSATIGLTSLALAGFAERSRWGAIWLTWWLGDAAGALVVTPAIVLWAARPRWKGGVPRLLEAVVLVAALALCGGIAFGWLLPPSARAYPLDFLCLPPLVWAAFRFGQRETATATLLLSGMAIAGTLAGFGSFAVASPNAALLLLQAYTGVTGVMVLALAAAVDEQQRAQQAMHEQEHQLTRLERDRAEEALRAREQTLAEAQALAHIGSWTWDIPTNVVTWSDELYRIFGLEPQSLPISYETFLAAVHVEDRARVDETVRRARTTGEAFAFDHRLVRPDGTERWLHGRGRVVMGDEGPLRMVGTGQDITDRRRSEQAGRAFLANAAHELRTPLTSTMGLADLIAGVGRGLNEPRLAEYCDMLLRQGVRARRLISGLLDVSRMEQGLLEIHLQPVTLADAVRRAADAVPVPSGRALGIDVADGLLARADPLRLEEALVNLLLNAYAYGGPGVGVDASQSGEEVRLSVWDDGDGVEAELVAHLFEPFARGQSRPEIEGAGLGLAIVKGLVQAQGGRVWYEAREPRGARFVIGLKRCDNLRPCPTSSL